MFRFLQYTEDSDTEAAEPLTGEKDQAHSLIFRNQLRNDRGLLFINIALFVLSIITLLSSYSMRKSSLQGNELLRATSAHSHLFDVLDLPLVTKQMNGTLLPGKPAPIYRQPPSAAVDDAWDRVSTRNVIPFGREDLIAMKKDPEDAAKFPDDWFGPDKYIGKIDAFHQIHCLDRIRRSLYWNFDHYYGDQFSMETPVDKYHTYHVDHCVYILLQNIQCSASVDVYPSVWMDAQKYPFPDFNIDKKCRDFDALLAWQEENSVDIDEVAKIYPRPDSRIHTMSHEFKEVVRWYDDHLDEHIEGGEIA